jgi:Tfp pilus assembly protein PilN
MIRINLAPRDEKRGGTRLSLPTLNLGLVFGLAALILAAAFGWSLWHLAGEERRLNAELDGGERELSLLRTSVGQAGNIKERLAELEARLKALQLVTRDQSRPLQLVDAFADAVPADVWITSLEDRGVLLRVTGSAFSATPVSNFMSALRASGRFKDVDIVISKQDLTKSPPVVSFEVTCRFES